MTKSARAFLVSIVLGAGIVAMACSERRFTWAFAQDLDNSFTPVSYAGNRSRTGSMHEKTEKKLCDRAVRTSSSHRNHGESFSHLRFSLAERVRRH